MDLATKTAYIIDICQTIEKCGFNCKDIELVLQKISGVVGDGTLSSLIRYLLMQNKDVINMEDLQAMRQEVFNKQVSNNVKIECVNKFEFIALNSFGAPLWECFDFETLMVMSQMNRSIHVLSRLEKYIFHSRLHYSVLINKKFVQNYSVLKDHSLLMLLLSNTVVVNWTFVDTSKFVGVGDDDDKLDIETSGKDCEQIKMMINDSYFQAIVKKCVNMFLQNGGFYLLTFKSMRFMLGTNENLETVSIESLQSDIYDNSFLKREISNAFNISTAAISHLRKYTLRINPGSNIDNLTQLNSIQRDYSSLYLNSPIITCVDSLNMDLTPVYIDSFDILKFLASKNVQTFTFPEDGLFDWREKFEAVIGKIHDSSKQLQCINETINKLPKPKIKNINIDFRSKQSLMVNILDRTVAYNSISSGHSPAAEILASDASFHQIFNLFDIVENSKLLFQFESVQQPSKQYFDTMGKLFYAHINVIPSDKFSFHRLKRIELNFGDYAIAKSVLIDRLFDRITRDLKGIVTGFYKFEASIHRKNVVRPHQLFAVAACGSLLYTIKPDSTNQTFPSTRKDIKLSFKQESVYTQTQTNKTDEESRMVDLIESWKDIPKVNQTHQEKSTFQVRYEIDFVFNDK